MIYSKSVTIPPNTAREDPLIDFLEITTGTINRWMVTIPLVSGWGVGLQVFNAEFQLLPLTPGEWIEGGMINLNCEENIEITQPPYNLELRLFNEDANFWHKVWIGVSILRKVSLSDLLEM